MMTLTSTSARSISNAYDRNDADSSTSAGASARAKFSMNQASGSSTGTTASSRTTDAAALQANDAARTAAIAKLAAVDTSIPDPVRMMAMLAATNGTASTGATGSTPATLAMMTDIAVASGSGAISDAQRTQLQAQYAQLQAQFTSTVNSLSHAQAQADHQRDSDAGDNAQSSDDRRSTLTRTSDAQAPQYVHREPQEQLVTTTKSVQVGVADAPQKPPSVIVHVHELHVGSDSYEPVAVKQTQMRSSRPAEFAQVAQQSTTHRVAIAQVTQIRQLTQVGTTQQLSVVA